MSILWVGSAGGMEQALIERAGIRFRGIETGQLRGKNPLAALVNLAKMLFGVWQSHAILRGFRPDVCLATGGYVCAPVVVACRMRGVPVLIYLPDMVPGAAIRRLSKLAQRVAVTFPEAAAHFGGEYPVGKAIVTGYPVREELVEAARDRYAARNRLAEALGCPTLNGDQALPLVLAWGGSQGARSINLATWSALGETLPHAHVLHVVGTRDWPKMEQEGAQALAQVPPELRERYHPVDYLHEAMPLALAAADLTVARAGASTLGEFPVSKLPSVLAPLPFAGVNQEANARQLAQAGAAVVVEDEALAQTLGPTVVKLLRDPARRQEMEKAAKALARPDAALQIAKELVELSKG